MSQLLQISFKLMHYTLIHFLCSVLTIMSNKIHSAQWGVWKMTEKHVVVWSLTISLFNSHDFQRQNKTIWWRKKRNKNKNNFALLIDWSKCVSSLWYWYSESSINTNQNPSLLYMCFRCSSTKKKYRKKRFLSRSTKWMLFLFHQWKKWFRYFSSFSND